MHSRGNLWVIVLAGGNGTRVLGATFGGQRLDRPKQFSCFGGDRSLLQTTLERASRVTELARVVPVVCTHHREWWESEFRQVPTDNVLAQPANRGNALAILHALIHILQRDAEPLIVILPSDHAVDDERALLSALKRAVETAAGLPRDVVLLGITPEHADAEYGWIVPALGDPDSALPVRLFVEKPPPGTAAELMSQGALWNSFIVASTGLGLLEVFTLTLPGLVASYVENLMARGWQQDALEPLYRTVQAKDFGRDVLECATDRLRVLRAPQCGWTDLGTPGRVRTWLERRSNGRHRETDQLVNPESLAANPCEVFSCDERFCGSNGAIGARATTRRRTGSLPHDPAIATSAAHSTEGGRS